MVLGWVKEKIREKRLERRARKKLKRIEEEEKIHKLAEDYHRKGLTREEARILAEKEVRGSRGSSLLDSFLKGLDYLEGSGGSSERRGGSKSKRGGKSKGAKRGSKGTRRGSRRGRSTDIFAEFDRYLEDLNRNIRI